MADERKFADAGSLRPVVRAAFGSDRSLLSAERLADGSKKGAYRLTMDNGGTALLYAWDESEDYWQGVLPQNADNPADPFPHASGLALFEAAALRLTAAGVRCPELLFTDRSRSLYPAEIAVVEDVTGGSLEALLERDPSAAQRPLSVLADWLAAMAAIRSPSFGKVVFVDAGGRSAGTSCEEVTLDHALAQLQEIAHGSLDEDRLRFYQLCMHLDLVAGPLRIAGTSHPDREWFRDTAEHHLQRALQFPP